MCELCIPRGPQYWQNRLLVWTDGSCQQNHKKYGTRKAGYGVWFNFEHPWNDYGPLSRNVEATNNNAEIEAAIQAINICANQGHRFIEIRTDSNFLLKSVTQYFPKWKARGWRKWDGSPIQNKLKFMELDDAINDGNMDIKWTKVCTDHLSWGNIEADKLARRGAEEY